MRADDLRFRETPRTDVRFDGSPGRAEHSGSERENLPDRIAAGVDYHTVRIAYRLANRLRTATHRRGGGHAG